MDLLRLGSGLALMVALIVVGATALHKVRNWR